MTITSRKKAPSCPKPNKTSHHGVFTSFGLFDSGVGGLSVLNALEARMPGNRYVYLGDTAHLPYGNKRPEVIRNYTLKAAHFLIQQNIDALILACNTATSVALKAVREAFPEIPVYGMIEAGSRAAAALAQNRRIILMGTERTIGSGEYETAIRRFVPNANITAIACPLMVAMAEEGWTDGYLAKLVVQEYLAPCLVKIPKNEPLCIILGCTHFPPFSNAILDVAGERVSLIDPAEELSHTLFTVYGDETPSHSQTTNIFFATDAINRFSRVGSRFTGKPIKSESALEIDLDNILD